ncbi:MAG: tyrosine-type recombinase/integrase [Endozoicomonadaceae bacterium]|nr:tyrosine-type recombinase/integrase [Endozoicomonadaceae bacterium]
MMSESKKSLPILESVSSKIATAKLIEFAERILDDLKPNTRRALIGDLNQYIKFCKEFNLPQFSDDIEVSKKTTFKYIDYMLSQKLARTTIKRRLSSVSTMYNIMDLNNPIQTTIVKKYIKLNTHYLAPEKQAKPILFTDVKSLPEVNDTSSLRDIRDAVIAYLSIYTLCRSANMINLQIRDINLVKGLVAIFGEKNQKAGESRDANISPKTCDIIKLYMAKAEISEGVLLRAITKHGEVSKKPLTYEGYRKIVKKLGFNLTGSSDGISTHSFRVGGAVSLAELHTPTGEISLAGGWKTATMPIRYTKQVNAKKIGTSRFKD